MSNGRGYAGFFFVLAFFIILTAPLVTGHYSHAPSIVVRAMFHFASAYSIHWNRRGAGTPEDVAPMVDCSRDSDRDDCRSHRIGGMVHPLVPVTSALSAGPAVAAGRPRRPLRALSRSPLNVRICSRTEEWIHACPSSSGISSAGSQKP
jgi:hypothetical protein